MKNRLYGGVFQMNFAVIDIGGTFIKYACMNEKADFISRGKIPTPTTGRDDFITAMVNICNSMSDIKAVAISLPGIIDVEHGICITSGNLKYNDGFNIVEALTNILHIPVTIENDAKCAAYAEVKAGSLHDVSDSFVLIFGTGIGGTFIKNRKIHRGIHFSSGEVSFIIPEKDGSLVESDIFAQCSTRGLCQLYADSLNVPFDSVNGEVFFKAVNAGDKLAIDCLDKITRRIAVQINNIQMIVDPERIAIGGGISAQPTFTEYIRRNLDKIYENNEFNLPRAEVVTCKFLNDANLIGALYFCLDKLH